ncbi:MAG: hypothetical protein KatS3mg056_3243 [Chloroflexus sp.]|nr:MAG: hypothetical protein KatS3mg056_3243 [Chloroflexus sp.]
MIAGILHSDSRSPQSRSPLPTSPRWGEEWYGDPPAGGRNGTVIPPLGGGAEKQPPPPLEVGWSGGDQRTPVYHYLHVTPWNTPP